MSTEKVWAYTAPGKLKLVDPEVAAQEGWEVDTRPPRGFSASVGVITPHLSAREAKLVSEQAGVGIRDRDDMNRVFKAKGFRTLEKGEHGDIVRRDLKEWKRMGGARAGIPLPPSCQPPKSAGSPLDAQAIYRQIVSQGQERRRDHDDD